MAEAWRYLQRLLTQTSQQEPRPPPPESLAPPIPLPPSPREPRVLPVLTVPPGYVCGICLNPMLDPVCTQLGHTYDRACIEEWFRKEPMRPDGRHTDPLGAGALGSSLLYPNIAVRQAVESWLNEKEQFRSQPQATWPELIQKFDWEEGYASDATPSPRAPIGDLGASAGSTGGGPGKRALEEPNVEAVRRMAERGDPIAQCNLGSWYHAGTGVPQDLRAAVLWLTEAAKQGNARAQNKLARCYHRGEGVPKDLKEAVAWYRRAAAQGNAAAQFQLGGCLENGEGVATNLKEAIEWYRKSADQGHAAAQRMIGLHFYLGEGVPKDRKQATKWFRNAAEKGDAAAQFYLGVCYHHGDGVSVDETEAREWFSKSSQGGHRASQSALNYYSSSSRKDSL